MFVCTKKASVSRLCFCSVTAAVTWRWRAAASPRVAGTRGRLWTQWEPPAAACPHWSPRHRFSPRMGAAVMAAWPARSSWTSSNWTRTGSGRTPDTVLWSAWVFVNVRLWRPEGISHLKLFLSKKKSTFKTFRLMTGAGTIPQRKVLRFSSVILGYFSICLLVFSSSCWFLGKFPAWDRSL